MPSDAPWMYGRNCDGPSKTMGAGSGVGGWRAEPAARPAAPPLRRLAEDIVRGRAGPSSIVGVGRGLTAVLRAAEAETEEGEDEEEAAVLMVRREEEAAADEEAAARARRVPDSPRRLGASKISRMFRSTGARGALTLASNSSSPSAGLRVAAETMLLCIAGRRAGVTAAAGRAAGRAVRNGWSIVYVGLWLGFEPDLRVKEGRKSGLGGREACIFRVGGICTRSA